MRISLGYIPKAEMSGCVYIYSVHILNFTKIDRVLSQMAAPVYSLLCSLEDSCLNTPCQHLVLHDGPKGFFYFGFV